MAEGLEIEGSHEEQFAIVKTAVKRHDKDLYGNGQPGVMDFMSATRGQFRLMIVMLSVIGLILTAILVIEGAHHFNSDLLPLFPDSNATEAAHDSNHVTSRDVYLYADFERTNQ